MQIDTPASSASPRAKRAKLEPASPSSKQAATLRSPRVLPKQKQGTGPLPATQSRSPKQAAKVAAGAASSKARNIALSKRSPRALVQLSGNPADSGSTKRNARKSAGLSSKAERSEPPDHSTELLAGPSSQAADGGPARHSARVSAGLLKEVQDLQAGLEGQAGPSVPSRTRRKVLSCSPHTSSGHQSPPAVFERWVIAVIYICIALIICVSNILLVAIGRSSIGPT